MKTLTAIVAALGALLMSCENHSTHSLLEDDQIRKEVFADIMSNYNYLREFMDSMRMSDHARMMMNSDTTMMNTVLHDMPFERKLRHLMVQTEKDSVACKMMCGVMMEHKKVMKTMLGTLEETGEVDKGCMKKMKEKKAEKTAATKHH